MPAETKDVAVATVTSKGQVTIPSELRAELNIAAGDKLEFHRGTNGEYTVRVRKFRSILDVARENQLPRLDPPFQNSDIDKAVADDVMARAARIARQRRAK